MSKRKYLLVQMRKEGKSSQPEFANFMMHSGLSEVELDKVNLYEENYWDVGKLSRYIGVFIGGISDDPSHTVSISKDIFPFIDTFELILSSVIDESIPSCLSCGGFMLASVMLGGRIELNPEMEELNILPIRLTTEAIKDSFFKNVPSSFNIVSGHQKSTTMLPPDCTLLASSERCPNHIFKLNGKPLYAFQGHPEITDVDIKERVKPYRNKYFSTDEHYHQFISQKADTTTANGLLKRFVSMTDSLNNGATY